MFTVVIPLYNKENTIQKTLHSILNQTYSNFEIIIINDGSTDRSRENAAEITDSRIKIIDQPNRGISSTRNRAIHLSSFPYIAMIDADDIWLPAYLEEQHKMINDFPEAGMWGVAWDKVNTVKRTPVDHGLAKGYRSYVDNYYTMDKQGHLFIPSATVLEKNALKTIGFFDENIRIGEDLDLFYRMMYHHKAAFYNQPFMLYNTGGKNRLTTIKHPIRDWFYYNTDKYEEMRSTNKNFRKYFDDLTLKYMYNYRLAGDYPQEVNKILSKIDFSLQRPRWRWLYRFPNIYKLYKKLSRP